VNHCLLEVAVLEAPQVRYTQDNQTPVAEMLVEVEGLRPDDPPGQLKVVGWGNLAQELQNRVQPGQRLVVEGRLRMFTVSRQDGVKEKRVEFTLARLHPLGGTVQSPTAHSPAAQSSAAHSAAIPGSAPARTPAAPVSRAPGARPAPAAYPAQPAQPAQPSWNTSPLVPDLPEGDDDIPF
jgi:single-strand DNA-binding protein